MSYVLGIDPSLTATGIACVWHGKHHPYAGTEVFRTTGRRADDPFDVNDRLNRITSSVANYLKPGNVALVVIEGPSHGSRGGSSWDRAGLWWRIVENVLDREHPITVVPPAVRAKWATGKGNAGKADVAVATARIWPDVPECSDDEWDALALASMGAQQLGWAVPTRAHHADARARVTWPDGLPAETAA